MIDFGYMAIASTNDIGYAAFAIVSITGITAIWHTIERRLHQR